MIVYKQRLNLQDATFTRIDHKDSIVAIVYKVTQPNKIDRILKICTRPGHYFCEMYFLKCFADKLPVPHVSAIVEPEAGVHGAIFMECLPGTLLQKSEITDHIAYEMGSLLARIHSNKAPGYGDLTQPHHLSPNPAIHFTFKFNEGLDECAEHLPKELLADCRRYHDTHINLLSSVDGPCITHRDFRPGNVIIHEGKIQGIIDWAGGRGGFAEEDFCPLEFGEWSTSNFIKESFLKGYASIRAVPDYENVMPLLRLSRAIATIGFTVKCGTWNNRDSSLYLRNRTFLNEFLRGLS